MIFRVLFLVISFLLVTCELKSAEDYDLELAGKCISDLGIKFGSEFSQKNRDGVVLYRSVIEDPDKFKRSGIKDAWLSDSVYFMILPDGNYKVRVTRAKKEVKLYSPLKSGWFEFIAEVFGIKTDDDFLLGTTDGIVVGTVILNDRFRLMTGIRASRGDRVEIFMPVGIYKYDHWKNYGFMNYKCGLKLLHRRSVSTFNGFNKDSSLYKFGKYMAGNGIEIDRKQAARFGKLDNTIIFGEVADGRTAVKAGIKNAATGDRVYMFPVTEGWRVEVLRERKMNPVLFRIGKGGIVEIKT